MNFIDLGSIDRLVRRNTNLLTAFKVIDDVDMDLVVENIEENITQFASTGIIYHDRVLDIVSENGSIAISYYFADRCSKEDVDLILEEVKDFCESSGVSYSGE